MKIKSLFFIFLLAFYSKNAYAYNPSEDASNLDINIDQQMELSSEMQEDIIQIADLGRTFMKISHKENNNDLRRKENDDWSDRHYNHHSDRHNNHHGYNPWTFHNNESIDKDFRCRNFLSAVERDDLRRVRNLLDNNSVRPYIAKQGIRIAKTRRMIRLIKSYGF